MKIYLIFLAAVNLIAFCLYADDKRRAKQKRWRIPEATLLWVAALGGAAGAFFSMQLFRHKTKHLKFTLLVPLFLLLHALAAIVLISRFGI